MIRPKQGISQTQQMSPRRMISLGAVGLLHVIFIYAIVTGLAQRIVKIIPPELQATVIDQPTVPKETLVPKPQMVQPPAPTTVTPPDIKIDTNVPPPIQTAVAPTAPTTAPISQAVSSVTNTHTTPPYPESARRQGVQGTVVVHVYVNASGSVNNATVTRSSGSPELDQTAVSWVIKHWRYKPAMASGTPVAAETDAQVVFDLSKAH
jgi:protein TonB